MQNTVLCIQTPCLLVIALLDYINQVKFTNEQLHAHSLFNPCIVQIDLGYLAKISGVLMA